MISVIYKLVDLGGCVAGGCAGAASRTVVSPLERLKIIQSDTTTSILAVS